MSYLDTTLDARSNSYRPNIAQYTEKQIAVLPVKFTVDNNEYVFFFSGDTNSFFNTAKKTAGVNYPITDSNVFTSPLNVDDCVIKCQNVLGLKINEIAKLVGVSRATLDLHRKGANVKDMKSYEKLYEFVSEVERCYGNQVKNGLRNVLVNKKTLVQHFIDNIDCLMTTMPQVEEVNQKLGYMKIINSKPNEQNLHLRLRGIGKTM